MISYCIAAYKYRHILQPAANLRTKIPDFREIDSSIIKIVRGGILMSMGNFLETLRQQILVGIILVGRLDVDDRTQGSARARILRRGPGVGGVSLSDKGDGCGPAGAGDGEHIIV